MTPAEHSAVGPGLQHLGNHFLRLIEVSGLPEEVAKEAMRLASHKLPIKTKMVAAYDLSTAEEGA